MARFEHRFDVDGGREVSVHLPDAEPTALVVVADGQVATSWTAGLDADDPAVLVVGVHSLPDEMARLAEYSPAFDPAVFDAHERWVLDEVLPWARERFGVNLPAGRTAICGASAGGELALALGTRHPEVFGIALAGSPGGGFRPSEPLREHPRRTFLVAGTEEPFFRENAVRWVDALRAADAEVRYVERPGGHGDALWRGAFPEMVRWAFPQG